MSNLFKKAMVFSDIHFGLKTNSITHNEDCLSFVKWAVAKAKERGVTDEAQLEAARERAKQREAAERRSSIDKRLRERDKPPAAPLPVPEAAK